MDCEILILGPVELRTRGRPHTVLGSAKERMALAALALDAGRPVSLDTLVDRLWDGSPPRKPRASVHAYTARIRKNLRTAGLNPAPRITQHAHAYTLETSPDSVDCHRFQQLAARARSLSDSGDDAEALDLLRRAERLWRGEPLSGLGGLWVESVRTVLREKRLAAALTGIAIELRHGRYADLMGDLSAWVERYPTDETLIGCFMTASYGCGRQADALRAYESARRRLREELGTDPGEALTRIHRLILSGAPVAELLPGRPAPVTFREAGPPPDSLPRHAELVGREEEQRVLDECLAPGASAGAGTVIALQAISGMAGVGKSLLALHTANRVAPHFPDGRIYVNLCAHAPGRRPLSPSAALAQLLRELGVPARGVPQDLDASVSLWRTLLANRRVVIVLDDASDPDQVRPLLPGRSPSLVLITSRRRLSGLPGVRSVFLDLLPPGDAVTLFRRLVRDERARDEEQVAEIVRLCGYLPLAVEIAAGRLGSRPSWSASHLIARLSRGHGRLREFRDGYREIARAFEMSYATLTPEQQTAFRLLGLHPGTEFDARAAAALTGMRLDDTEQIVDVLLDAHLVRETAPDRYRFHDLLGEYARTLTAGTDSEADRDSAVRRLTDYYLRAADRADRLAHPRRARLPLGEADLTPCALPDWSGAREAKEWLVTEHPALVAAERRLRESGRPRQAALLAHALAEFLDTEGYWPEAHHMHEQAVLTWERLGDRRAEARARIDRCVNHAHAGRYGPAATDGERALSLAREAGDQEAEAEALNQLGTLYWHRGDYPAMLAAHRTALRIRTASGDLWHRARSTNNLGIARLHLGDHAAALRHFREALAMFGETGDARGQAQSLNNQAEAHLHTGARGAAREAFARVLTIALESGSRTEQAVAQSNLASTFALPAQSEQALRLYGEALASFRRLGDRRNVTITLVRMGDALLAAGRNGEATGHHAQALELARELGAGLEEIQALRGLGTAAHRDGQLRDAGEQLEAALDLARRIHSPEEEAKTCATLAEVRLAAGSREEAVALCRAALRIFERFDATESGRLRKWLRNISQS
ncbi:BTAD domain-containing putative transcriptional regulator [Streptomyces sp. Ru87]|uniref:AfsR/SARP family transcriptional regulator n=1 Tax=Streptomyces sp. Ru87 TaxID=2044307 RepID=UPI000BFA8477|nr:BTAD domain-containing putative transcriptional regulator [Streptomyces sp. Ru87]PGH51987.1 transcriptional regulator [Streptomyces sp. Ru87]